MKNLEIIKVLREDLNELLEKHELKDIHIGIDEDDLIDWYTSEIATHNIDGNKLYDANENWEQAVSNIEPSNEELEIWEAWGL